MKAYRGVDVYTHIFLTSALVGDEWSASRPGLFTPGERAPVTHWIWSLVDPRAGLDDMKKWKYFIPPGLELRALSRPASSQSLYPLRYPGSHSFLNRTIKDWNRLPAGVLESWPCKLNTFRKKVREAVTGKRLKWGLNGNWTGLEVMWSYLV
jgi:hypothetical protein